MITFDYLIVPQSYPLLIEYPITSFLTDIHANERLERLEKREAIRSDPRLAFFSVAMAASSGNHSVASKVVDECYGRKCLFCNETENISKAHLVAGNRYVDYSHLE